MSSETGERIWAAALHRELLRLIALAVAGIAAFVLTRELAKSNDALRRADAAAWYQVGLRASAEGNTVRAVDALRRAAGAPQTDRDVSVALAHALHASHQDAEAVAILSALQQARPEDADVTSELARLESAQGDRPAAIRHFEAALDALWSPEAVDRRRALRLELISLLLAGGERARALSQILLLGSEIPNQPSWLLQVGDLFMAVGDGRRALNRYAEVLVTEPDNPAARRGAGRAAFAMGDYTRTRQYLDGLAPVDADTEQLRAVSEFVLTADPLAVRLSGAERERRLQLLLQHASDRLDQCAPADQDGDLGRASLRRELEPFVESKGRARGQTEDANRIADGVELAVRIERAAASCAPADPEGRAVLIMARLHGLSETP